MASISSEFKNSTNKVSVSIRKTVFAENETDSVAEDGSAEAAESKWIKCVVTRNLPKTLEAYAPDTLAVGNDYVLAIKTRPAADGTYSVGFSDTVKAAE